MKKAVTITEARKLASPYQLKSKPIIGGYCRCGTIPSRVEMNAWFIEEDYLYSAINWRKQTLTFDEALTSYTEAYGKPVSAIDRRAILKKSKSVFSSNPWKTIFTGEFFIESKNIHEFNKIVDNQLVMRQTKESALPLKEAANIIGISPYQLHKQITSNTLPAVSSNNEWYIYEKDISDYLENREKYICVYDTAIRLASIENTVFDPENRYHRSNLYRYLQSSEYRECLLSPEDCGIIRTQKHSLFYSATMAESIEAEITIYFRKYGKSLERNRIADNDTKWGHFPRTKEALDQFSLSKQTMGIAPLKQLLISFLECEIMDCTNSDINNLVRYAKTMNHTLTNKYLSSFIEYVKHEYSCAYTTKVNMSTKTKSLSTTVLPYSKEQYMKMAYMTYTKDYIDQLGLINRAIQTPKHAYTWLFVAMHYVCAWRKSDIDKNLPILSLPDSPETVISKIHHGTFGSEAKALANRLMAEINNHFWKPEKTEYSQNERALIISIPSSLGETFGIIYAIYCYHVCTGAKISKNLSIASYVSFYGDKYKTIFGEKPFSNLRACKSYLSSITQIIEGKHGINSNIMGYAIAQFARAHVTGSSSTSRYLETKLDGLGINEILTLLFEAGTCSFIPYFLLQIVYGEDFRSMDVGTQNSIILQSNLSAYKAEKIATLLDNRYHQAKAAVDSIMKNYSIMAQKHISEQILVNLVSGTSLGDLPGINCLCAARRVPCPFPNRDCFGCIYGIPEASFFYTALNHTKQQYKNLEEAKTIGEITKWRKLLDEETLPAMCEILTIAEKNYGIDVGDYKQQLISIIENKGIKE